MKLFLELFLIPVLLTTTTSCTELFHNPNGQIHAARENCTKKATLKPTCHDLCALENANMLTQSGNAYNPKEFGPYYEKYAEMCWNTNSKPTCDEAHTFLGCFYEKSKFATKESMEVCQQQFPVENLQSQEVTAESMAENQQLACLVACFGQQSYVFNANDTINMECINPHIPFKFNAPETAKMCEDNNKQDDTCQKRANTYICLIRGFEEAMRVYFTNKPEEFTEI